MPRKDLRDEFLDQIGRDLTRRISAWDTKYRRDDYTAFADLAPGIVSHYGVRLVCQDKSDDTPIGVIDAYLVIDRKGLIIFDSIMTMRELVQSSIVGDASFEPGIGRRGRGFARSFLTVEGPYVDLRDGKSRNVARTWSVGAVRDLMAATEFAFR